MARLLQGGIGPEWPMKRNENTCFRMLHTHHSQYIKGTLLPALALNVGTEYSRIIQ